MQSKVVVRNLLPCAVVGLLLHAQPAARGQGCAFCDLGAPANLLDNPGVEQGSGFTNITGWVRLGSGGRENTNGWGFTGNAMHDGAYALKGWWDDFNCYQSNLPVVGGRGYRLSAYFYHSSTEDVIANSPTSTRMFVATEWFDSNGLWLATDCSATHNGTSAADVWTQIVMDVTAPTSAATATFHVETDSNVGSGSVFGDGFFFGTAHPGMGWCGTLLNACETLDDWSVEYDGGSSGSLQSVTGLIGKAVQMDWNMGTGSWVQAKLTFPEPRDLSDADMFGISLHGGSTAEQLNAITLMVADTNDVFYGETYSHTQHGLNQVDRWMINVPVPKLTLEYFWGPTNVMDWAHISGMWVAVKRPTATNGGGSGQFLIDHIQCDKAADWPRQTAFETVAPDPEAESNVIAYVLSQQRTNGLVVSWKEQPDPVSWLYDEALALLALTRAGSWAASGPANAAATGAVQLASFLVATQKVDGTWARAWDPDTGQEISSSLWVGDQAWCVVALSRYAQQTWNTSAWAAAKAGAAWISSLIDATGKVHYSTEGNVDAWYATSVALRTNDAAAIRDYLLDGSTVWDPDLKYWWVGLGDAGVAEDCAAWISSFARHPSVGETNRGLAALTLVGNALRAVSDDQSLCGLAQSRGALSVQNEWSGQYVAAGGENAQEVLDMLLSQQKPDGGMPQSPDTWGNCPFGEASPWTGLAPSTWMYFGLTGQPFPADFGACFSGTVSYAGAQAGPIRIVATNAAHRAEHEIAAPGAYAVDGHEIGASYWVGAYRDSDQDGVQAPWEACGTYAGNPIGLTNFQPAIGIVLTDPDVDADNMPDYWEYEHFGHVTNGFPQMDSDTDGFVNVDECIADTNPTNPASFFTNAVIEAAGAGTWMIQAGPPTTNSRVYDAQWKTNLVTGAGWAPCGLNVPGDAGGAALPLLVTNYGDRCYYRAVVTRP